jgi:hypothetical protein
MIGPVYIAGPMSGIDDYNIPTFAAVARRLRAETNCEIISPHELDSMDGGIVDGKATRTWADYLRRDLTVLARCNTIVTLPGWAGSRGARLEVHVMRELGCPRYQAVMPDWAGSWEFHLVDEENNGAAHVVPTTGESISALAHAAAGNQRAAHLPRREARPL